MKTVTLVGGPKDGVVMAVQDDQWYVEVEELFAGSVIVRGFYKIDYPYEKKHTATYVYSETEVFNG